MVAPFFVYEVSMEDEVIYWGDAVKAEQTEKGVKLGGYLVRFGDSSAPDLTGDYFTKSTDFGEATTSDVWFNHRMPVKLRNVNKQVSYKEKLPKANLTVDDIGIFAEVVIEVRNEYEKTIAELGMAGKLAWSSGTASHLVDRKSIKNGVAEITRWPLGLDASLTPTPAEFRKSNQVTTIKSIMETKKMDETIDVKTAVEDAVKAALAERDAQTKAEADKQAAIKAAEEAGYQKALEEIKNRKAPAFNKITTPGFSEEKDAVPAFKHWVATGQENQALIRPDSSYSAIPEAKTAWNVTTGGSGGYLVPDPLYNTIIEKRNIASWVRQLPVQKFQTSADHLLVPRESTSHTAFVLTAEGGSYDENEGTVSQKDLILYKYTKLEKMSEEFVMYNQTNFDSWLSNALGRAEALTENTIFTTGTGTGQPEGVLIGATDSSITTAALSAITPAELTSLIGKLGGGYNVPSECGFLMANATKWYMMGLNLSGPFAYGNTPQSPFFGYQFAVNDNLDAHTVSSGKPVVFGNFNFYGVVEKPGMLVQRNPYLFMGTGQVGIYASIFRGGGVLQSEAFYYLNNHS